MNNSQTKHSTHPEPRTIKSLQTKIKKNDAMILKADKAYSLIIVPTKQYDTKIQDFIQTNNFQTTKKKSYQKLPIPSQKEHK